MQRAIQTMAVPSDQILYASSHASDYSADYGERQVWVYGDKQMRWLEADSEEVYAEGQGTTRWWKGKIERHPDVGWSPTRSSAPARCSRRRSRPRASTMTEEGNAYVLQLARAVRARRTGRRSR